MTTALTSFALASLHRPPSHSPVHLPRAMSTPPSTPPRASAAADGDDATPSQLAARAKLVEVRGEVASLHDEMARLKDDLAQMTQTYMRDMQAMLMETITHAMAQQATMDDPTAQGHAQAGAATTSEKATASSK